MSLPSPRHAAATGAPARRRPVVVTPEADGEAAAALAAYRAQSAGAADAFDADLAEAYDRLADAPLDADMPAGIARRRVGRSAFAVVYVVEPRRVLVAALVRLPTKATR